MSEPVKPLSEVEERDMREAWSNGKLGISRAFATLDAERAKRAEVEREREELSKLLTAERAVAWEMQCVYLDQLGTIAAERTRREHAEAYIDAIYFPFILVDGANAEAEQRRLEALRKERISAARAAWEAAKGERR